MLSQMRERNFIKIVLWAVVIAFVATMVFVWGADFQGIGCSGQTQAPQGKQWVAMVGDVGIGIREFDGRYRQAIGELTQSRQPGQAVTEDERLRVLDQVYEQIVNETLFQQEVDRLGLRPTDEEVLEVLQTDPPDFLRRQFVDETGVFNMDAYQQALADPRINWVPIEEAVRQTLPFNRLQQIFASQVHVSEGELVAEYERRNTVCSIFYAGASWRDMELAEGQPDSAALRAYYESHRDDYMEPERYRIAYVEIPRKASAEDEAFVLDRVQFILDELAAGRSFEDLARDYSEDPGSAENGGDLGWFGRGRMVPEFTEASFSLAVGEVSEPVRTDFGYHLIKKEDERLGDQGEEEVKVRHILLAVEPSYATVDSLTALADTLAGLGKELESLAEAGTRFGLEVGQPKPFSLSEQVEGLGFNSAVRMMADRLEPGEVSRPFMGRDASYVIQLLEDIPEGPASMENLPLLSRDCERDMKQELAREKAEALHATFDRGMSLRAACEEMGMELQENAELKYQDYLPGVGAETALHLLALHMEIGAVSPVLETPQGHWIVELAGRIEADPNGFPDQRDAILQEKLGQAQQQLFESWIENLRESYGVQDFRDQFYK